MNWIEHMQAAAADFRKEAAKHNRNAQESLENSALNDAKAIEQLIEDIEYGRTQEKKR